MKERPIIMSGPSPKLILDGKKTQTRRIEKLTELQPSRVPGYDWTFRDRRGRWNDISHAQLLAMSPYGEPGDRLWVRESFYCDDYTAGDLEAARAGYVGKPPSDEKLIAKWRKSMDYRSTHDCHTYEAGCPCSDDDGRSCWRSPLYMPRWASRILLEVVSTRVERIQDITAEDAIAEGINIDEPVEALVNGVRSSVHYFDPRTAFAHRWCALHGPDAWKANPWVRAVTFKLVEQEAQAA